jgi:hypothetical protein
MDRHWENVRVNNLMPLLQNVTEVLTGWEIPASVYISVVKIKKRTVVSGPS